jgi:hypothetical protein
MNAPRSFPLVKNLNFFMQPQQQDNWCWAAVAASVSAYFNPHTIWTQCRVANGVLGRTDCCPNNADCNVKSYLEDVLRVTGNLEWWKSGECPSDNLVYEIINNNRPVCVRVAWKGPVTEPFKIQLPSSIGHFFAITGFNSSLDWVTVMDPAWGLSMVSRDALRSYGYRGSGIWTTTYFVRP